MEPIDTQTANRLATGAPGTITLGEHVYIISQPTKADMVTLRKHLNAAYQANKSPVLAEIAPELAGLSPELQRMAIEAAVKLKDGNRVASPEALEALILEPANVAFWVWLLVRRNHPEAKLDTIRAAVTEENVDTVIAEMMDAGGLREIDPN